MRKVVSAIILILALNVLLTGCGKKDHTPTSSIGDNRFVDTNYSYAMNDYRFHVFRDTKTDNLYLVSTSAYSGGISPFYGADGQIMKWQDFKK